MSVNVKMGVDLGGFTAGIREGQNVLKGLNAEMKATEAEFKATGNAEQMLANKTKTLTSQLNVQKGIADAAQAALQKMAAAGVDPASAAYQKMYVQLMNAQAGMNEAQAALNALDGEQQAATQSANELADGMASIGKKISLDQVITGIGKITSGLENAARKAAELSGKIWDTIMESAQWGDDIATQASMAQMGIEEYQRVVNVAATAGETSTSSLIKSWKKLKMNLSSDSKDVVEAFKEIGVAQEEVIGQGREGPITKAREYMDVFWEIGDALMAMGDGADQERYAQTLLGRSWQELIPMFLMGREAYEEALKSQDTVTEDSVKNLGELNDQVIKVQQQFDALKSEVIGKIAPAFTEAAGVISDLLHNVNEYLKTDEGQQMLESLGTAVSGLFDDLGKIEPDKVVEGFVGVFNTVVDSVKWVVDHSGEVIGALGAIVTGWGALKLTGGVLDIVKLIDGIGSLNGGVAAAAGKAAGAAWGSGFASAVAAAAPWLIGLYTLLNPGNTSDKTGDNTLVDENGNLTREGQEYGYKTDENGEVYQDRRAIVEAAAQVAWDQYRSGKFDQAAVESLRNTIMNDDLFGDLTQKFREAVLSSENWKDMEDIDISSWLNSFDVPEVEVSPVAEGGAAADLASQIGTVYVPVVGEVIQIGDRRSRMGTLPGHANGLPYVPYDGYLAELHRGEMVVPAREISSRNYSSNLYVESMIMNNGTDAQGLAAAMAAAQRRTMAGYGS